VLDRYRCHPLRLVIPARSAANKGTGKRKRKRIEKDSKKGKEEKEKREKRRAKKGQEEKQRRKSKDDKHRKKKRQIQGLKSWDERSGNRARGWDRRFRPGVCPRLLAGKPAPEPGKARGTGRFPAIRAGCGRRARG